MTVLLAGRGLKPVPVMVTVADAGAAAGENPVITGWAVMLLKQQKTITKQMMCLKAVSKGVFIPGNTVMAES
nr:hypothetical protein [uncultured Lacibacter sp.]